jgi:broad-specificity NMP kinase
VSAVIWINGPFGVGKTTVAERVAQSLKEAIVFDPELVGSILRMIVPPDLHEDDYQDMPIWRSVVRVTTTALVSSYQRPVIVPMTLLVPAYFHEIVGDLRLSGIDVAHFTLLATPETVRERLEARGDSKEWALAQLPRCLPALENELFAEHVTTDRRSADEVAELILTSLRAMH